MKNRAPRNQSTWRSLTRKLAVIMRTRLCIQPSATSWRIPASTIGNPVRPAHHAAKRSSDRVPVSTGIAAICSFHDRRAESGQASRTSA